MTFLVPMSEPSHEKFIEEFISSYARDNVESGLCSEECSVALAQHTIEKLLPQGLATSDSFLFDIHAKIGQPSIGVLWFLVQDLNGKRHAFLCYVHINSEYQRKGHATRAFVLLEEKISLMGISDIALHVFGHNVGAQSFYKKLGFRSTNINMLKQVRDETA